MSDAEVKFCYQCGKRVQSDRHACWYCSTPLRRRVRPKRRCPFCGEEIRPEAIKCRHCGEHLTQQGASAQASAPQDVQSKIVIDKLQDEHGQSIVLPAGRPVPPQIAEHLSSQTIHAIETVQFERISEPGVRALPAPEDLQPGDLDATMTAPGLPTPTASEDDVIDVNIAPASRQTDLPGNRRARGKHRIGNAMGKGVGYLWGKMRSKPKPQPTAQTRDFDIDDPYRLCPNCRTEILAKDNYCYHCGTQFHRTNLDKKREKLERSRSSHLGIYIFSLILIGLQWAFAHWGEVGLPFGDYIAGWYAWVACLLVFTINFASLMRKPGFFHFLAAALLIAGSVALNLSVFITGG